MKTFPHLIVCEHCDAVYRRRRLAAGEVAHCESCASTLYRAGRVDIDRWLALSVAAAILFAMANACPMIRVDLYGQQSQATLWQSVMALAHSTAAPIAVPTLLSVIVVPFLQIVLLCWVLAFARTGQRAPGFALAMKTLGLLRPWSMVEIALLGALVAIFKLSSFVDVTPAGGIWATAGLMALVTFLASRDIRRLWDIVLHQPPADVRA